MISKIIIVVLVIDFLGFVGWALSGGLPTDEFYIGTITTHVIKLFI